MYKKGYGIIETQAPLHVGASAGEEAGNLNLIFRDQFTQTGIIPGSSIRGRFRADMRFKRLQWLEKTIKEAGITIPADLNLESTNPEGQSKPVKKLQWLEKKARELSIITHPAKNENEWYGHEAVPGQEDSGTTEAIVKFEYASLIWFPVFCPGQPIVWVTSPMLLKRYQMITKKNAGKEIPAPYTASKNLSSRKIDGQRKVLFFNLGFMEIEHDEDLSGWIPEGVKIKSDNLVVVDDNDLGMIHDMALYHQSRVKLGSEDNPNQKKVDGGAFFSVEALPEGCIMIFPVAMKPTDDKWPPLIEKNLELYFGGLESIGFGRCNVTLQEVN